MNNEKEQLYCVKYYIPKLSNKPLTGLINASNIKEAAADANAYFKELDLRATILNIDRVMMKPGQITVLS